METKVRVYGTWHRWDTRHDALAEIGVWVVSSEGSERDRYTNAYLDIRHGACLYDEENQ